MRTLPPQNPAAALLALLVALTPACGGDQPPADSCRFNEDCATPIEYCEAFTGRCVRYECFEDQECSPTQRCSTLTNTCVPRRAPDLGIPPEPDDDMGPGPEMGPGSRPEMGSTNSEPDPFDRERPRILELDPAPGAELPEQGASIEITFSEAIDPLSLSEFTITMTDQLGRDVDLDIEPVGDPPTGARVAPVGALAPATSFELTISGMVRDLAMNTLGEKRTEPYFTRFVPDPARAAIARRWAPVIYQGLLARQRSRWRLDVPARVNFDGDWRASDNLEETLSVADYEPAVYYQVLETETQVFVFYVLYYPRRVDPAQQMSMPIEHEHDMTGAVFVIDRASDALVLVEGLRQEESTDQLIAYLSEEGGLSLPGEGAHPGQL